MRLRAAARRALPLRALRLKFGLVALGYQPRRREVTAPFPTTRTSPARRSTRIGSASSCSCSTRSASAPAPRSPSPRSYVFVETVWRGAALPPQFCGLLKTAASARSPRGVAEGSAIGLAKLRARRSQPSCSRVTLPCAARGVEGGRRRPSRARRRRGTRRASAREVTTPLILASASGWRDALHAAEGFGCSRSRLGFDFVARRRTSHQPPAARWCCAALPRGELDDDTLGVGPLDAPSAALDRRQSRHALCIARRKSALSRAAARNQTDLRFENPHTACACCYTKRTHQVGIAALEAHHGAAASRERRAAMPNAAISECVAASEQQSCSSSRRGAAAAVSCERASSSASSPISSPAAVQHGTAAAHVQQQQAACSSRPERLAERNRSHRCSRRTCSSGRARGPRSRRGAAGRRAAHPSTRKRACADAHAARARIRRGHTRHAEEPERVLRPSSRRQGGVLARSGDGAGGGYHPQQLPGRAGAW